MAQQQQIVTTGDSITIDSTSLIGHGVRHAASTGSNTADGSVSGVATVYATVSGVVQRVNKLVTVQPLLSRYVGAVGDVVVGRIVEVRDKQWKVDVGSRQHGSLALSAVHLPGGVQRRRTAEDELHMRVLFVEHDIIVAEVQKLRQSDGAASLHTRNLKYGKLWNGQLCVVPSALIQRCKQHFQSLPCGVDMVLGLNGYIWVYDPTVQPVRGEDEEESGMVSDDGSASDASTLAAQYKERQDELLRTLSTSGDSRERIARVCNCIHILASHYMLIWNASVTELYIASLQLHLPARELLNPDVHNKLIAAAQQNQRARATNTGK